MGLVIALAASVMGVLPVEIVLKSPKVIYSPGEEIVLSAQALNRTNGPIAMVTQQDSMHWMRKAPYMVLEMKRPNGAWEPALMKDVGRCGNANPIRKEDFVRISPGSREEILRGMPWSKFEVNLLTAEPSAYWLRLRYDTRPQLDKWIGGPLVEAAHRQAIEEVRPLYEAVPKGLFYSNVILIRRG